MLIKIARKEFIEMWRDGRFRWANAIVFTLLIAATLLGWHHAKSVHREREAAQSVTHEQWLNLPAMNPHSAAHYSVFAFKPSAPLALADTGVDPYAGVAVWLEAHNQNEATYSAARDATGAMRFGQLTAALVLQLLIPLMIVLLSFAAFAGERESGTLRQTLSQGVSRNTLVFGKIIGIVSALATMLAPATMVGAFVLLLNSDAIAADGFLRFTLLSVSYLAYFAVFLFVSLAVSALARSARIALIVLLAFWSFNLILPRAATDLAKQLVKTPSALDFKAAVSRDMREGIDGHNPNDKRAEELKQKLLDKYNVRTIEELPINFSGVSLQESEEYGNRVAEKHYGDLWAAFETQNMIHALTGIAAPLAAVRPASMGLSGTDWNHHLHFAKTAEDYRRMLVKHMNDDLTYNSFAKEFDKNIKGRELYEQVPPFVYAEPTFGWAAERLLLPFGILMAWLAVSGLMLFVAVDRMSVDAKED